MLQQEQKTLPMRAFSFPSDMEKRIFLNDQLEKNSDIEKILQQISPQEKEKIIENIINNFQATKTEEQSKPQQGYIYGFKNADYLMNGRLGEYPLKIGATSIPVHERIKQWQRDDSAKYTLVFALLTQRFKRLESLMKLLYSTPRKHIDIGENNRIEWFQFKEGEPVVDVIIRLNRIMEQFDNKFKNDSQKEEQKLVQFNEIIKNVSDIIPKNREGRRIVLFGNSDSAKKAVVELMNKQPGYFSRNQLKKPLSCKIPSQKREGALGLAEEFQKWITLCSSKFIVPILVLSSEEMSSNDSARVINNSLQVMSTYFSLRNILVILTFSQKSKVKGEYSKQIKKMRDDAQKIFNAKMNELEWWGDQNQRQNYHQIITSDLVVLDNSEKQSTIYFKQQGKQTQMFTKVEICEENRLRFSFGETNIQIARSISRGYQKQVRYFLRSKLNKWFRNYRTSKNTQNLITSPNRAILRTSEEHSQIFLILNEMAENLQLDDQQKLLLFLFVHCYLRLHNTLEESPFLGDLDNQINWKKQQQKNIIKKNISSLIKKFPSILNKYSEEDLIVIKPYLKRISQADDHDNIVSALRNFHAINGQNNIIKKLIEEIEKQVWDEDLEKQFIRNQLKNMIKDTFHKIQESKQARQKTSEQAKKV